MEVGVVVGRFQVDSLHDGHRFLINKVFENHRRVIIFIGVSPIQGTKHDPLDFQARLRMVQSEYPDAMVLPLYDQQNDQAWSDKLDESVLSAIPNIKRVNIYWGRDSSAEYYKGRFSSVILESKIRYHSGEEQRQDIGAVVRNSPDFRAGIIYSTQNSWPYVKACVDIALVNLVDTSGNLRSPREIQILLGRKVNETKWRLPGGMVTKGSTFENDAVKELQEETNIKIEEKDIEFLISAPVGDWRMKKAGEIGLITCLFAAEYVGGDVQAGDDLVEVKWFPIINAEREVMNGHKPLVLAAKRRFLK